jgi:diguanylate cyclase (GGDEF)-like protein
VARTDGLTGCLNHAALHDGLAKEIERALRGDHPPLSLILIDLDDFKQINELHGHLVGDEVLRRAGHALRHAMRPYDLAARYGGDEFALVAVDADEATAVEMAERALARLAEAIEDLLPPGNTPATAGVAEWSAGVTAVELVARADRALLHAKQEGFRGGAHTFGAVPSHFRPGRFSREDRGLPEPPPMPLARDWPESQLDERLRRRSRQLALANELGARLSAMTRPRAILDAAVEELSGALGYSRVSAAPIVDEDGTRSPILADDGRELAVPLWIGDRFYGALHVQEQEPGALDNDDVAVLETVATHVGQALRGAQLYEQLERAYLGTAEALAAALEAKDAYTADHARSIVAQAETVARRLGLTEDELRDLRFAAVFHDIGKIAVPEAILHKPGPLSAEEREVMERHTIVGEQILAPVEFLAKVRTLVRHEHERWDGAGYPDGLSGEEIPLGSRIILVCDALHAMTSDRPYRQAMSLERATAELRRHAGSQFDPAVVDALLGALDAEDAEVD